MHVEAQLVKLDLARIYRIDSRIKCDALATEINVLCSERSLCYFVSRYRQCPSHGKRLSLDNLINL